MSYDTIERSASDGRPVELYRFLRGESLEWLYTSADRDLVVSTKTYRAAVLRRGPIAQSQELQRSNMKITCTSDFPIASMYKVAPPSDPIALELRKFHYGDTEIATIWQGTIASVAFRGAEADIELVPLSGTLNAAGNRRAYQKTCPYDLYGKMCRLDPEDFRTNGTADAIAGLNVTVTAADGLTDGHFSGGVFEWEVSADIFERRFITSHVGATISLDVQPIGLAVGGAVRLYPGCDHSIQTCQSKFANNLNFGGMPYIPQKNPFGGEPIY